MVIKKWLISFKYPECIYKDELILNLIIMKDLIILALNDAIIVLDKRTPQTKREIVYVNYPYSKE